MEFFFCSTTFICVLIRLFYESWRDSMMRYLVIRMSRLVLTRWFSLSFFSFGFSVYLESFFFYGRILILKLWHSLMTPNWLHIMKNGRDGFRKTRILAIRGAFSAVHCYLCKFLSRNQILISPSQLIIWLLFKALLHILVWSCFPLVFNRQFGGGSVTVTLYFSTR